MKRAHAKPDSSASVEMNAKKPKNEVKEMGLIIHTGVPPDEFNSWVVGFRRGAVFDTLGIMSSKKVHYEGKE